MPDALTKFKYSELPLYIQTLLSAIIQGDLTKVQALVTNTKAPIGWWWEPYATLSSKQQFECLQHVMDQPTFRFDAPFLASCCYFTPKALRSLVWKHPRARRYILNPTLFETEAREAYRQLGFATSLGTDQRLYYGSIEVWARHKRLQKLQATVLLASFFTVCSRVFLENYYKPGGRGYLKGKASFEANCF